MFVRKGKRSTPLPLTFISTVCSLYVLYYILNTYSFLYCKLVPTSLPCPEPSTLHSLPISFIHSSISIHYLLVPKKHIPLPLPSWHSIPSSSTLTTQFTPTYSLLSRLTLICDAAERTSQATVTSLRRAVCASWTLHPATGYT